jgi:hypothetical protein
MCRTPVPISLGRSCGFSRKEVIQPHLPVRLPCYDFVLVTNPTLGAALLAVRQTTLGITGSHDVTGGVYKTRERIHGGMLIHHY